MLMEYLARKCDLSNKAHLLKKHPSIIIDFTSLFIRLYVDKVSKIGAD